MVTSAPSLDGLPVIISVADPERRRRLPRPFVFDKKGTAMRNCTQRHRLPSSGHDAVVKLPHCADSYFH
jgi:hypothetical protein